MGVDGTKGAMIIHDDGSMTPNRQPNKSAHIEGMDKFIEEY